MICKKAPLWVLIKKQRMLLMFLLPALVAVVVFNYIPIGGILMAFENYKPALGFLKSPWVGFKHFETFLNDRFFYQALVNTLSISSLSLLFGFPAPIILALMIDNIQNIHFKKITQTITYLPHFVSWVVIASLVYRLLGTDSGVVNIVMEKLGLEPVKFLSTPDNFWTILISTSILKEIGWGSIIYLAAIASIDSELYDAAKVDGAGPTQRTFFITLPGMMPSITLMFVLSIGTLVTSNFDAVFNLSNPMVLSKAEVLETFVLRSGVMLGKYSYSTAIGFSQSVFSFILVMTGMLLAKKYNDYAIL